MEIRVYRKHKRFTTAAYLIIILPPPFHTNETGLCNGLLLGIALPGANPKRG
jgi:hypothetical protein